MFRTFGSSLSKLNIRLKSNRLWWNDFDICSWKIKQKKYRLLEWDWARVRFLIIISRRYSSCFRTRKLVFEHDFSRFKYVQFEELRYSISCSVWVPAQGTWFMRVDSGKRFRKIVIFWKLFGTHGKRERDK